MFLPKIDILNRIRQRRTDQFSSERRSYPELEEWKRDFETEGTIFGGIREEWRSAIDQREFEWPTGCAVEVNHLNYISQTLQSEPISLPQYFLRSYNTIKNHFFPDSSKQRYLLKDISFKIREGEMTLVLGSPGSGKSSLCKIVANQGINGTVEGDVLFGGTPLREKDHSHRVAYVSDSDIHLAHLTVKQTFEYAFDMLNPHIPGQRRDWVISSILEVLGLSHRADTIVGDDLNRGVSGGERRRVTIGVELMKRAQLLVMDEATTGLDSSTSLQIFRVLRIAADEFSPVLATLKQPGEDLYELFDNVIVLHEGQIVYNGKTEDMMDYFEGHGYSIHRHINPADEVLTLVDNYGDELVELYATQGRDNVSASLPPPWSVVWRQNQSHYEPAPQAHFTRYARSFFMQFLLSTKRGFQLAQNNPDVFIGRIILSLIMSLMVGTLFLQLDHTQSGLAAIKGSLFMVAIFPAYMSLSGLPTIYELRPVFYYQRRNNYYHAIPVILANFLVSSPVVFVESVLFSTICYWMVGFNDIFVRYLCFTLLVISLASLFNIVTTIAGFILPSFLTANIIVPELVFVLNFFTGFVVLQERAPIYLQWLYWLTPFRYVLEALYINEFSGATFYCENEELVPPLDDQQLNAPFELGGFEGNQMCPITNGEDILRSYDYETSWEWSWYFLLVLVGFNAAAFFVMILCSYFEFKPNTPRDLRAYEDQKEHENQKINNAKTSVRHSIAPEASEPLVPALNITKKGRRLETNVPVVIEWHNISYKVKTKASEETRAKSKLRYIPGAASFIKDEIHLLHNVSGYVKPGMLVAFMGPSGAGKTTLLDVLAQRKSSGHVSGEIRVNGEFMNVEMLPRFSGYVEQQNIHVETETVHEALIMSATLRLEFPLVPGELRRTISRAERLEHVNWVMNILSLTPLRSALISELSLEQKKRFTIGIELAANPSVLWLDEPTSGLDAMAALNVMRAVKRISENGVAVICTLHQPSEILFSWCTHLLLLARGGHVVYFGDSSDNNHDAKQYFTQFGLHAEGKQNDADFFLDCCSSSDVNCHGETVEQAYENSAEYHNLQGLLEAGVVPRKEKLSSLPWYRRCFARSHSQSVQAENERNETNEEIGRAPFYSGATARSPLVQWIYLTSRNVRTWWRTPLPLILIVCNAIMYGITISLLYSNMDHSQAGAAEHISIFFFVALVLSSSSLAYSPQIFGERPTLYRETSSKTYHPIIYFISMISVNLPLLLCTAMIVLLPIWSVVGLQRSWYHVGYFFGTGIGLAVTDYLLLICMCFLSPGAEMGNGLFAIVSILQIMVNGFLLIRSEIPSYWIWFYWIAQQHYALEGLVLNEIDGERFFCPNHEGAIPISVPTETNPLQIQYYCPLQSSNDVFSSIEMHDPWPWKMVDILVIIGMMSLLLALCSMAISKFRHIKR